MTAYHFFHIIDLVSLNIQKISEQNAFFSADNTKHWSLKDDELTRMQSKSINIEITAYGLLTLIEANMLADGVPIFQWILQQRNSQGGFEGTQDTVVGLQALASYAEKLNVKNRSLDLTLKMEKSNDFQFTVNDDNALTLQSFEVIIC